MVTAAGGSGGCDSTKRRSPADTEPLPPTIVKDTRVINKMVNRLYAPEELQRTKEEARQKRAKEKAELYSVRRDPHLQEYWRAKHLLDTTATTTASRRAARIAERRQRLEHERQHATTGTPPPQHLPPLKAGDARRRSHPDPSVHGPVPSSSLSFSSESSSGGVSAGAGAAGGAASAGRNATGEKARAVEEIDGAPMCPAMEEEEEEEEGEGEAPPSDKLAAGASVAGAGGPAGAREGGGGGGGGVVPSGVLKSDLTALSIMLDPPVHFQSRVHRLQLSTGCYDVGWVRRFFRGDDSLGPGVEAQLADMRLLTLEDIPVDPGDMPRFLERQRAYLAEKARRAARPTGITALQHFSSPAKSSSSSSQPQQQQQHPSVLADGLPAAPVVLSSPRSALCALRRGVSPAELLPRPLAYFEKQVGLEGAPAHVVERRYRHFEAERGALLSMLLTSYREICASLTLVQCLRLLKTFNPEHNFDVALQEDLRDAAHFVSTLAAEGGGGGARTEGGGGGSGGGGGGGEPAAVRCFSDVSDEEDSSGGGGGGQREASPQRAGETGALTTQDGSGGGGGSSGCTAVSTTAGTGAGTGTGGANESKEFRLREKCRTALDRAKEKMQGHLVRTILLKRVTQKKADERSEKMTARLQKYSEEKGKLQEVRHEAARKKAEACKLVVSESKAIAEAKYQELISRQEDATLRRLEVNRLRRYTREINREEASLRVKSKRECVLRQQNINEWNKLCLLDRIRRRTDKSAYQEKCMSELLAENKYAREVMLRESEEVMKTLQQHLL